ncbi:hypothetical protein Glove_209g58 [Diversispora epigaea]|uniref:Uncharacterized protein n=1 Tax=Diversispora epigaea TaxID=1348612 RepID=A0A397IPU6_9GLOM|nr:hypothetical protein Glove_209g58 [Diversispora epigaea]
MENRDFHHWGSIINTNYVKDFTKTEMSPFEKVGAYFSNPLANNYIHIIIQLPTMVVNMQRNYKVIRADILNSVQIFVV